MPSKDSSKAAFAGGLISQEFVETVLDQPHRFLAPDAALSGALMASTKKIFDKFKSTASKTFSPLDELLVEGFDETQVWEQMMLEFGPALDHFESQLHSRKEHSHYNSEPHISAQDSSSINEEESLSEEQESDDMADEEMEGLPSDEEFTQDQGSDYEEEVLSGAEELEQEDDEEYKATAEHPRDEHGLNDGFFSLDAMEKFADIMEEREEKKRNREEAGLEDDDEEEDDFINGDSLFRNPDEEIESDEEEDDENANEIRYEDFFEHSSKSKKKNDKRVRFDAEDDHNEISQHDVELEAESEEEVRAAPKNLLDDEDDQSQEKEQLSTFEKHQAKMGKLIESLEAEAVAKKDWTLKGEVNSKARPLNSLLEEELDVDYAAKPVPVVTEESTATLEDLIKQRIKDESWDDVVKRVVIQERAFDPNRRVEMNDQKNSKSLADVYEEEYIRQTRDKDGSATTEKDEELLKQHKEIDELFGGLCQALDALSNAHYTPRAPTLDIQVLPTVDVPAISMEEVIPATVSDAKLVAPEEVYQVKLGKSNEEMTSEDRKKIRGRFKKKQKKVNEVKKMAQKDVEGSAKMSKKRLTDSAAKEKALKELMGQENVTIITDPKANKVDFKKSKAQVIQKGGKVRQERPKQKAEMIKL